MNVQVINVRESNTLSQAGQIVKTVVLTYKVGTQGPFTLVTTQQDIQSGAANTAMQNFAQNLATLPGLQG
jgi:hypothetical protein